MHVELVADDVHDAIVKLRHEVRWQPHKVRGPLHLRVHARDDRREHVDEALGAGAQAQIPAELRR